MIAANTSEDFLQQPCSILVSRQRHPVGWRPERRLGKEAELGFEGRDEEGAGLRNTRQERRSLIRA